MRNYEGHCFVHNIPLIIMDFYKHKQHLHSYPLIYSCSTTYHVAVTKKGREARKSMEKKGSTVDLCELIQGNF